MAQNPEFDGPVTQTVEIGQPEQLTDSAQLAVQASDEGLEEWPEEVISEVDRPQKGTDSWARSLKMARVAKLKSSEPDLSYREIGIRVGLSATTVSRICRRFAWDVTAKDVMQLETRERIREWRAASQMAAARGKHEAARDWLLYSKAIDPVTTKDTTVQVGVQVVVAPIPGVGNPQGHVPHTGDDGPVVGHVPTAVIGPNFPSSQLIRGIE